jgi:hypothetical protein
VEYLDCVQQADLEQEDQANKRISMWIKNEGKNKCIHLEAVEYFEL